MTTTMLPNELDLVESFEKAKEQEKEKELKTITETLPLKQKPIHSWPLDETGV